MHVVSGKIGKLLLLLSFAFSLQSCFDLVEQLNLHTDGSGDIEFIVNMSKSKTRVSSILAMKTINGRPVPTQKEIQEKVKEIETLLKNSSAISNVSSTIDWNNYIATLKCNFRSIEALNKAVKAVSVKQKMNAGDVSNSFMYNATDKIFTRVNNFSLKDEYNKLSNADKEIFNNAFFTSIIRFDQNVKSVSNPSSKTSADKKAVMLREKVMDIVTGKTSIENKINLSN